MAAILSRSINLRRISFLVVALLIALLLLRAPLAHRRHNLFDQDPDGLDWDVGPEADDYVDPPENHGPPAGHVNDNNPATAPVGYGSGSASHSVDDATREGHGDTDEAPDYDVPHGGPADAQSTPRTRLTLDFQEYLTWDPPDVKDHYPPYSHYVHRDYDPNRWEGFQQDTDLFINGTLKGLSTQAQAKGAFPYNPYPKYESDEYRKRWRGRFAVCSGPGGVPPTQANGGVVTAYEGLPEAFPAAKVGSFEAVGLDGSVCFDRYSRMGPYGVTESEESSVDFEKVDWQGLQNECVELNRDRFRDPSTSRLGPTEQDETDTVIVDANEPESGQTSENGASRRAVSRRDTSSSSSLAYKPRTAILLRAWEDYNYQENDVQNIRAMISELSLQSGGEYQVFLFVNVKDPNLAIYTNRTLYSELLNKYVPEELHSIALLWSELVNRVWYPKVGSWEVYWQQFMGLQWFTRVHPEFDYIWNWEMDARYIGHYYHFTEAIVDFAKRQPRKYLWERNARYYIPELHGSWDQYVKDTNKIVEEEREHVQPVWGPQPQRENQRVTGPSPPTLERDDDFKWGVGEEADLITLLPIWDPRKTDWSYRNKLFGAYGPPDEPYPDVDRRVFINTLVRFSTRLLEAMHAENIDGYSMVSEMWPATVALQHGLKAVYAPHPIWLSHHWPADYMDHVINADGWGAGAGSGDIDGGRGVAYDADREQRGLAQTGTGPNGEGRRGRWGQERDSPYSPDREHNFGGWSWYFWSDFARTVYFRWLGWRAMFTIVTVHGSQSWDPLAYENWAQWEKDNGRLCLPSMLLHPVKNPVPPPAEEVT